MPDGGGRKRPLSALFLVTYGGLIGSMVAKVGILAEVTTIIANFADSNGQHYDTTYYQSQSGNRLEAGHRGDGDHAARFPSRGSLYQRDSGSAHILASEAAARGVTTVIAAGGDGTINETAGALLNTSTALGIIPCGSGNGLARHLNIPMDPAGAVDVIASGHIERCDYGTADGSPFFCTFRGRLRCGSVGQF